MYPIVVFLKYYHLEIYPMKEAFVLINCETGSEDMVVDELSKVDSVLEVQKLMGVYDIIAKLEGDSDSDIKRLIASRIQKLDPVNSVVALAAGQVHR